MAGISSKAISVTVENRKKFVCQDFDDDFEVSLYQFKFRTHNPQIGRFLQIDPLASDYVYNSTYSYAENRPIDGIDLEGTEFLRTVGNIVRDAVINPAAVSVHLSNYLVIKSNEYQGSVAALDRLRKDNYSPQSATPPHIQKQQELASKANDLSQSMQPVLDVLETTTTLASAIPFGEAGAPLVSGAMTSATVSVERGGSPIMTGAKESSPGFIVDAGGQVFPVPKGATGPLPTLNKSGVSNGVQFIGGSGGENGQVSVMRIMNATLPKGKSPGYPNGYIKYENVNGQGVNPYTGKTGSKPETHFPLSYGNDLK